MAVGVGADHVDLAESVGLVRRTGWVHLRPAGTGEAVGVECEEEALGVEPVLGFPGAQHVDGPAPLLGVAGEGAVVQPHPIVLVLADAEAAHGHAVGPAHRLGEGKRDA